MNPKTQLEESNARISQEFRKGLECGITRMYGLLFYLDEYVLVGMPDSADRARWAAETLMRYLQPCPHGAVCGCYTKRFGMGTAPTGLIPLETSFHELAVRGMHVADPTFLWDLETILEAADRVYNDYGWELRGARELYALIDNGVFDDLEGEELLKARAEHKFDGSRAIELASDILRQIAERIGLLAEDDPSTEG